MADVIPGRGKVLLGRVVDLTGRYRAAAPGPLVLQVLPGGLGGMWQRLGAVRRTPQATRASPRTQPHHGQL